ncbi:MAG: hypothetical protein ACRD12_02255, partial [Acidimicrobiales bacterium]
MPGDDQASALLDGWIDAQRQMWQAWADSARSATTREPGEPVDGSGPEIWRDLIETAFKAWAHEVLPLAQAASRSIAESSERTVETLQLSWRAWRALITGGATSDWDSIAGQWVGLLSQALMGGPSGQLLDLWRLSFDELARFQRSWLE